MPKKSDTLRAYLRKDSLHNTVEVTDTPLHGSKDIITKYRVIAERGDQSLLEVELVTGLTHQIRAHLAHIGHPLLGDGKYGVNRDDRALGYKHQALYACRLIFDFKDDTGALGYLKGREVALPTDAVWFYDEFFKQSAPSVPKQPKKTANAPRSTAKSGPHGTYRNEKLQKTKKTQKNSKKF